MLLDLVELEADLWALAEALQDMGASEVAIDNVLEALATVSARIPWARA
jgi:hypothetical protein